MSASARQPSRPTPAARRASASAHSRPPACSTSSAAAQQVVLAQRRRAGRAARPAPGRPRAAGQRGDDRQRLLPGPQVGAHRLAGHLGRAPDAEQVVGELEGQADVGAERRSAPMASSAGAPTQMAPMLHAQASSGGGLVRRPSPGTRPASRRRGARTPGRRPGRAISRVHGGGQAAGRPDALRGRVLEQHLVGQASSASPARIAAPTPNTAHTVGRCRRSVSPSMMSSCSSEKLCTSSTATAAGDAALGRRPGGLARTAAPAPGAAPCRPAVAGRRPVRVAPAQVVGGDRAASGLSRSSRPQRRPVPPGRGQQQRPPVVVMRTRLAATRRS